MNDFNLRPEVMGFGRPERVLAEQPTPVPPGDAWKARGDGFEVNDLGQLRTALALPASEYEIAASMRHADAPAQPWYGRFKDAYDALWVDKGVNDPTATLVERLRAMGNILNEQEVPQQGRTFWHAGMLHTDACQCDGCAAFASAGRFAPTDAELQRPLAEMDRPRNNVMREALVAAKLRAAQMSIDPPMIITNTWTCGGSGKVTPEPCHCDGCTATQLGGRFTPTDAELQRPLSEILAERGKAAQAAVAPKTKAESLFALRNRDWYNA